MFKIRKSKYRHIFCDPPKPEQCFTGFRMTTVTGDQQYVKASAKYFSVGLAGGGGSVLVARHDRPGRFESGTSQIVTGHTGAVMDMDWNPFDDSMMATGSEDCNIKIWSIPEDWEPTDKNGHAKKGENMSESLADLVGHMKKVTLLRYNPSANNTLLSASADCTVRVWDVENSTAAQTYRDNPDLIHDIVWDHKGDVFANSAKDKTIRFVDGRAATTQTKIENAHGGAKTVKLTFAAAGTDKFLSFGSSKQSAREIKVWDLKNTSAPLHTEAVDTAAGGMIPLFDHDTNVIYLCGKGDGIIRIYEFENKAPYIFKLNDGFRSNIPGKGYSVIPKRGLNIMGHETTRILKVTNNEGVHPLRFIVPRKSDAFQEDIFPDCCAPSPAHTFAEWKGGSSKPPVTMSLNPALTGSAGAKKKTFKTVGTLQKELDVAQKRIEYLEKKLQDNNISID